ncbi:c-type cytochrome [Sphingopyxis sp. 113P3]|uniref:c-type cytochrome n=1 Tax=Sphingopyxis sp. (strain 113P3) TaxID=292913 RepID=UPI0006AD44B1|nr:c-type cytochrome [Sphingopyxis sp. 113P3]ALC14728.1 hypothetical protein LH20_22435 [Sphingopyxis sp. 113P3]
MKGLLLTSAVLSATLVSTTAAQAQTVVRPPAYARCAACHSVVKGGPNGAGPNLFGVVGRKAAAAPGYSYSPALKKKGGVWTRAALERYITDPTAFAPGGKMMKVPTTPADRAAILAYLTALK